jgi:DNA repair protein RecO (recombination protein O)
MTRVNDEACIILHTRAYRETSLIVSGFCLNQGRISLMARGVRNSKRGRLLQPLNCLRIGFGGRSSMMNLGAYEVEFQPQLVGDALVSGMYMAELITRLLSEHESHPQLFAGMYWALENLSEDIEGVLRQFEKLLLDELGYGLDFSTDAATRMPIDPGRHYRFDPEIGFVASDSERGYPGDSLLSIGRGEFRSLMDKRLAKRIFRQALTAHLGAKPLMSRKLLYGRGNQ